MPELPETRRSLLLRLNQIADQDAWNDFVAVYESAIYRYARSRGLQDADAREVVQEVLLAVHDAIAGLPDRPGSFRAWLLRVAHNKSITLIRRRRRQEVVGDDAATRPSLSGKRDEDVDHQREWRQWAYYVASGRVQNEVQPLTWSAFWMTAVANQSPDEVAAQLGMTVGAVYTSKCRVLARIREQVQRLDEEAAEPQRGGRS